MYEVNGILLPRTRISHQSAWFIFAVQEVNNLNSCVLFYTWTSSWSIWTQRMDRLNPSVHNNILSTGSYVKLSTVSLLFSMCPIRENKRQSNIRLVNVNNSKRKCSITFDDVFNKDDAEIRRRVWHWICGHNDDAGRRKIISALWHRTRGQTISTHCKNPTSMSGIHFHWWETRADCSLCLNQVQMKMGFVHSLRAGIGSEGPSSRVVNEKISKKKGTMFFWK